MSDSSQAKNLLATACDLQAALQDSGLTATLIGGVAVSMLAVSRYTADIDALVVFDTAEVEHLLTQLARLGFSARTANLADFARRNRVLLLQQDATGVPIDISLGCMPFEEEVVERSTVHKLGEVALRLATPEDLVIMKAVANRPKDQEDIRGIARVYPNLDRKRIGFWVEQYGDVLDNPDLWPSVEALLQEGAR